MTLPKGDEPVHVTIERTDAANQGRQEHVKAKYVVGCDGARSVVRKTIGIEMKGDFANQAWGVLDALIVTDFPDIRLKTAIHSADDGSILIIPREGGYLARFYIEMDKLKQDERVASKNVTAEVIVDRAKRIFAPYTFDVREIAYWSVYEVGQRLTDHFDDVLKTERDQRDPRVFIAGDACHTHSAKAGQGMNVSMNDSFNLGWKLASVLHGRSPPSLLHTYSEERQDIARVLIEFDREMSRMFAAKPKQKASADDTESVDPAVFQDFFTRQGRFMAGLQTKYKPGPLTSSDTTHQHLATGYEIGTRFQSDLVLRVADAKPVHLGHTLDADGRWRIVLFNSSSASPSSPSTPLSTLYAFLEKHLIPKYTPPTSDIDSLIDFRAIFTHSRKDFEITDLPSLLLPHKGRLGVQDYEKAFTDEVSYGFGGGELYQTRGVSREEGAVVVVRPDQYISAVMPLAQEAEGMLERFFDGVFLRVGKRANGVV